MGEEQVLQGLFQKFGRTYNKDSIIFFEEQSGEEMYIILAGKVEIVKSISKYEQIGKAKVSGSLETETLAVLQPGDFFGEMSLLNDKPRSATARALEQTKVIVLNKENFEIILEKQPKLSLKMLKVLSNRIRSLDELLEKPETSEEPTTLPKEPPEEEEKEKSEVEMEVEKVEEKVEEEIKKEEPAQDLEILLNSSWQAKLFLTAIELEIFELLEVKPLSVNEISQNTGCDISSSELFLNNLVIQDFLIKEDENYKNNPKVRQFLSQKSGILGDLKFKNQITSNFANLETIIKKGKTDDIKDENILRRLICQMNINLGDALDTLLTNVDLSNAKRFFEAGENPAFYAIEIVKRLPKLQAIVLDKPHSISITDEFIAQFKLGDKVNAQIGDYKKASFGKNNDIVLLSFVLHLSNEKGNLDIINRAWDSLNDNGTIVIHNFLLKENKIEPKSVLQFALNLLVSYGGKVYTFLEVKKWLEEADFQEITGEILKDYSSLVIGRKEKT